MRPPVPVPPICPRSTLCSSASRRTSGESTWPRELPVASLTRPFPSPAVWGGASTATGCGEAEASAAARAGSGAGVWEGGAWRAVSACGGADPVGSGWAGGSGGRLRGGLGLRRWRFLGGRGLAFGGGAFVDHGQLGADADRLALRDLDLDDGPRQRRRDLGVHLVRGDLEQGLVPIDVLALLLQPAGDRSLDDGLAELGHRHRGRHFGSSFERVRHRFLPSSHACAAVCRPEPGTTRRSPPTASDAGGSACATSAGQASQL